MLQEYRPLEEENSDDSAFMQHAKAGKEHYRPFGEVSVVFEKDPGANLIEEMELLREFVWELIYLVGKAPD